MGMDVNSSAKEDDGEEERGDGDGDGEIPDSSTSQTPKNKSKKSDAAHKVRPALPVLTLTNVQATLAALESNQLLHLRRWKRYYAEALNFMRMVEGC